MGIEYHACPGRPPIELDSPDIGRDLGTGFVSTAFESAHDVGLQVGGCMPALLKLDQGGQSMPYARGTLCLWGITADDSGVVYRYHFGGHEVEDGRTPKRRS